MEKIFKSKSSTKREKSLFAISVASLTVIAVLNGPFAFIALIGPIVVFLSQATQKYIVKENGDLWVKNVLGTPKKATGIYHVLYDPKAKGWRWRTRQMIVGYQKGLKKAFSRLLLPIPKV